jgi:hypothetical protein
LENKDSTAVLPKVALGLTVVVSGILMVLGKPDYAKGFALGSIFSIINFALLKRGVKKRLGKSVKRVRVESFFSIMYRYVILAVPIMLAFKLKQLNIVATLVGLFTIQVSILLYYLVLEKLNLFK